MTDYATAEGIRRAHALEIHPSAGSDWVDYSPALLDYDYPHEGDQVVPEVKMQVRITYGLDGSHGTMPDMDADFTFLAECSDATVRSVRGISQHDGVFAVAIYAADNDGTANPYPSSVFSGGMQVL